jgi:predicted ATP-grasp superfamily ATP-dependent carboligase
VTRRILVCDGEQRTALAAVRSLGRAGYAPVVLSAVARPLAAASRYATATARVADPLQEPAQFLADVREAVVRFRADLVLPATEQSTLALSSGPEDAGSLPIAGPDRQAFLRVSNKQFVLAEAAQLGLDIPRQVVMNTPREELRGILDTAPYPVAIKSAVSVAAGERAQTMYATNAHELEAILRALPAHRFPLLIQERIIGPGEGVFVLLHQGRLVASFAHRRIREFPPSGGRSVCAESTALDPDLLAKSVALLEHLGWDGPAMVEYKRDSRSGRPMLMEVNGRLWGSLQLAVDAGVDFPVLMVRAALGEPLPAAPPVYRVGIRLRSVWGDVDHLLTRLVRGRGRLQLAAGTPGRVRTLVQFLTPHRRERAETLRSDDPLPFAAETVDWLQGHVRALRRLLVRRRSVDSPPAIVLGTSITALGVLRAFRAAGRRAFHLPEGKSSIRLSRAYHAFPHPAGSAPARIDLDGWLRQLPIERAVLVPCSDSWVRRVAALDPGLRDRFPAFVATPEVLELVTDKARFAELTTALGVPHPRTWPITGPEDLAGVPESVLDAAFLKPRDSQAFFERFGTKAFWVHSRAEARQRLTDLAPTGLGVELQEYVPGPPTAHYFVDGFADDTGRVRAAFARQRLRMYPRDFGNSTVMRSVPLAEVRPALEAVERLVRETGYRGVFSAEFKRDARDGLFKVLELNARPWWYVEFAARCGVDVCDWAYTAALGGPPPSPRPYELGAVCTYPYYDFYAVRALRGEGKATWGDFFRTLVGADQPVFRWSDPLPALSDVVRILSRFRVGRRAAPLMADRRRTPRVAGAQQP